MSAVRHRLPTLVLALTVGVPLSACGQDPEPPPAIPNAPTPNRVTKSAAEESDGGTGALQARPQNPGGCSSTYHLSGRIDADAGSARQFWVISALWADPNWIHYPKARLTAKQGPFELNIPANTDGGLRTGRFLLVSADAKADEELELSKEADENRTEEYSDEQRIRLPAGAHEIAQTPKFVQRCT
jgi:hypothetical protein